MDELEKTVRILKENGVLSQKAMQQARLRWDAIAKPIHGLGRLEDAVVQIAGIRQAAQVDIQKTALVVFCADNGVVEEGVAQAGQEVTRIVAGNFLKKHTCTSIFCEQSGTEVFPVDIGMAADVPGVERHKCAYGTKNMAKMPAMTREQALFAINEGIALAERQKERGMDLVVAGEMGIGNTTSSSAVCAALLGEPPQKLVGRGAGISLQGLEKKRSVVSQALQLHRPDAADPVEVLSKVGGYDIAGMAGFYLGAARHHLPVILDGFISQAAALVAVRLCPQAADAMIASHVSAEYASRRILQELGKEGILDAGLCLGEGSGGVLCLELLQNAVHVYEQMSTFADIQVQAYERYE